MSRNTQQAAQGDGWPMQPTGRTPAKRIRKERLAATKMCVHCGRWYHPADPASDGYRRRKYCSAWCADQVIAFNKAIQYERKAARQETRRLTQMQNNGQITPLPGLDTTP